MTDRINFAQLRTTTERANQPGTVYSDVCAMWDELGPATVLALLDVAVSAHAFIDTTSVFRQRRESRPEFTDLAVSLDRFDFTGEP